MDRNQRYRFRIINSFCTVCPGLFTIEGHDLTVIATDAESTQPVVVNSIVSSAGANRLNFSNNIVKQRLMSIRNRRYVTLLITTLINHDYLIFVTRVKEALLKHISLLRNVRFFAGERYDFVINTDKPSGSYWIQLRSLGDCTDNAIHTLAILQYSDASSTPLSAQPSYNSLSAGVVSFIIFLCFARSIVNNTL